VATVDRCRHVRISITPAPKLPALLRAGSAEPTAHDLMNAKRSELIVSASVVGMPCGKPL